MAAQSRVTIVWLLQLSDKYRGGGACISFSVRQGEIIYDGVSNKHPSTLPGMARKSNVCFGWELAGGKALCPLQWPQPVPWCTSTPSTWGLGLSIRGPRSRRHSKQAVRVEVRCQESRANLWAWSISKASGARHRTYETDTWHVCTSLSSHNCCGDSAKGALGSVLPFHGAQQLQLCLVPALAGTDSWRRQLGAPPPWIQSCV